MDLSCSDSKNNNVFCYCVHRTETFSISVDPFRALIFFVFLRVVHVPWAAPPSKTRAKKSLRVRHGLVFITALHLLLRAARSRQDPPMLIGHGFDIHRLVAGKELVIGGVNIPYELGADAHSDGDVIYHSVVDAILGERKKKERNAFAHRPEGQG